MRNLDLQAEIGRICEFIKDYVYQSGFANVVVGISGGMDSSLSAALAVKALGNEHVLGVMLPYKNSNPENIEDASTLAEMLSIHTEKVDITPMVDAYFETWQPDAGILRKGNWMARVRMCVLYDLSAKYEALVLGTSNRTELLVGYFTQHGDGACAFEPIGHLYKTEVWQMGKLLNIPNRIIQKVPTADLWSGQTDEGELGITYSRLDEIVYTLTEIPRNIDNLYSTGFTAEEVAKVRNLISRTEFKRKLPTLITD